MATNETTAKFKVDISDLKKNITEANRQIRLANAEFKSASTGMDNWQKSTNGLSSKINQLNTVLNNQKKVLDSYYKELELVKQQYGEDSKEADNLKIRIANQEAAINKTTAELKQYENELKKVTAEESKLGQVGDKLQSVGDKMSSVGATLSKTVTAAIVALGAAAIKSFQEVDKGMDIVVAKTGATGKELEGLQDTAKRLATTLPVTFEEAGSAVGEVNTRFGVTGDKLETLSAQFLKFAKLNNTDVSTSIDLVQKTLEAFGLTADDAGAMLDTLNAVGQKTGISVDKLAQSMVTNGSTLKEMGFNASQAASFLGKLEKSGVDSSQALTGLKMALKNSSKEGKSLQTSLKELQAKIKGSKDSTEAMSKAMEVFGARAGSSLGRAIYDGTMNLEELSSELDNLDSNLGNVDETFGNTLDGFDQMTIALNSLKLAGSELGSALGTALAPIMERVAEGAVKFADWFKKLSPETQDMIVKIGLMAAAIGPLLVTGGKVLTGIGSLSKSLGTLMGSAESANGLLGTLGKTMGTLAAIGVIVVGVKFIYETINKEMTDSNGEWDPWSSEEGADWKHDVFIGRDVTINGGTVHVESGIELMLEDLPLIGNLYKEQIEAISDTNNKLHQLGIISEDTNFTMLGLTDNISVAWQVAKYGIDNIVTAIKTDWNNTIASLGNAWTSITTWISQLWDDFKNRFQIAGDAIVSKWNDVTNWIGGVWTNITNWLGGVWDGFKARFEGIGNAIAGAWTNVTNWISGVWDGAVGAITGAWNSVSGAVSGVVSEVWGALGNFFGVAVNWGSDLINGFISGIQSMWGRFTDTIKSVAETIFNFLHFSEPDEGPLKNFHTFAPDMIDLWDKGIKSNLGKVRATMNEMAQVVADTPLNARATISSSVNSMQGAGQGVGGAGVVNNYYTFEQTNNSPKALSTIDIYRQTRNQFSQLKGATL